LFPIDERPLPRAFPFPDQRAQCVPLYYPPLAFASDPLNSVSAQDMSPRLSLIISFFPWTYRCPSLLLSHASVCKSRAFPLLLTTPSASFPKQIEVTRLLGIERLSEKPRALY